MNKLEIKEIDFEFGNDIESLKNLILDDKGYCVLVEMAIGLSNSSGADIFRCTVCNNEGLKILVENEKGYQKDQNKSITSQSVIDMTSYKLYIMEKIEGWLFLEKINEILDSIVVDSKSWRKIALELDHYFNWEYRDEWFIK